MSAEKAEARMAEGGEFPVLREAVLFVMSGSVRLGLIRPWKKNLDSSEE